MAGSRYGQILVDGAGLTLYLFTVDSGATSACYGACAAAWPPLLTKGPPLAGKGVSQALVGTISRADGNLEITYNGHPLYRYQGDHGPGDVFCQAAFEYGGGWYIVDPSGNRIATP